MFWNSTLITRSYDSRPQTGYTDSFKQILSQFFSAVDCFFSPEQSEYLDDTFENILRGNKGVNSRKRFKVYQRT